MNITYTREYSQVAVATDGDLKDIVKSFYCNMIGIDSDSGISIPVGFTVTLISPDPSIFINYQNLTKDIFDGWVTSFANPNYYENVIADTINITINPPTTIKDLPF